MTPELPQTHPLPALSLDEARQAQFRLMECIAQFFDGRALLNADVGVTPEWGRPETTRKVEQTLAAFFGVEACALTQGAGTGSIRAMLAAAVSPGGNLVIHAAPPYRTSAHTFEMLSLHLLPIDYNRLHEAMDVLEDAAQSGAAGYVQHARHDPEDAYSLGETIRVMRACGIGQVLTDENYTALRVPKIGAQLGAEASAFSLFKLLGPEGVGCVVGVGEVIDRIHTMNYSGGGQVQGHQAMEALRSLVLVPVAWAIQSEVVYALASRLSSGEVPGVKSVRVCNAQDLMLLVSFEEPIAQRVVAASSSFGAQTYPVGSNSRYDIAPFLYRLSDSFLTSRPELRDYAIRLNPTRAGTDLAVSILERSIKAATA